MNLVQGQATVGFSGALAGDANLISLFKLLPEKLQIYAIQPAVTKAIRTIAAAIKPLVPVQQSDPLAPEQTALLQQSIGISKIVANPKTGTVFGAAGPRRGFTVQTKGGLTRFTTSKSRALKSGGQRSSAVRYAHLVDKPHRTRGGGMTEGSDFMGRGFNSVAGQVQSQIQSDVEAGIFKQAARLAKRGF